MCCAILLLSVASAVQAQAVSSRPYVGFEAGPVFAASRPGRSSTGVEAGVIAGHEFLPEVAAELRLRMDYFTAPTVFISPGGCLGQTPCDPPQSQRVRIGSLAVDGVVGGRSNTSGPLGVFGVGVRNLDALPLGPSGIGSFAELGGGFRIPIHSAVASLEARYQMVFLNTQAPRWTLPTTLAVRF